MHSYGYIRDYHYKKSKPEKKLNSQESRIRATDGNIKSYTPDALKLITRRCQGLVKLISKSIDITKENELDFKFLNRNWNFLMEQVLNPNIRFERRCIPLTNSTTFAFDPLLQTSINPTALLDHPEANGNYSHTCMTSTTLFPRDGKMALFGTEIASGFGLLFDITKCDLKGERFVFEKDAHTDNDWWLNENASFYHHEFKSQTINDLRENTALIQNSNSTREYNEVMAGVNAKSVAAIVYQSKINGNFTEGMRLSDAIMAIFRKHFMFTMLGRHLPIIILDIYNGPYEYSFDTQQKDLNTFLAEHPNHQLARNLLLQNLALLEKYPVEYGEELPHEPPSSSLNTVLEYDNLLFDKLSLINKKIKKLTEINIISARLSFHSIRDKENQEIIQYQLINAEHQLEEINLKLAEIDEKIILQVEPTYMANFQEIYNYFSHSQNILAAINPGPITYISDFYNRVYVGECNNELCKNLLALDKYDLLRSEENQVAYLKLIFIENKIKSLPQSNREFLFQQHPSGTIRKIKDIINDAKAGKDKDECFLIALNDIFLLTYEWFEKHKESNSKFKDLFTAIKSFAPPSDMVQNFKNTIYLKNLSLNN